MELLTVVKLVSCIVSLFKMAIELHPKSPVTAYMVVLVGVALIVLCFLA